MEFFSKGVSSAPLLARVQTTKEENAGEWMGDLNSTMHFLYNKMFGFYGVQHLKVSEFSNLRGRWNNDLPVEFFCYLESLVIDDVNYSSYAIPSNLLEYLNKLEKMDVSNYEVLEDIFYERGSSEEHGYADLLSKLSKFNLISLPRLRNIWNEHDQGILNFKHLKSLNVHLCSSLRTIFTPSITQGLVQMQELEVKYCNSVKEIITKVSANEVMDEIVFPLLQSIILESFPGLISLNGGSKILKCPSLEEIAIVDCPTIFSSTFLRELQSNPTDGITVPKAKKCKVPRGVLDPRARFGYSYEVQVVSRVGFDMIFPKLIHLKLKGLPKFTNFWRGNIIQCPSMKMLWIENCPHLQKFVSTSNEAQQHDSSTNLFDEKVDFPNLDILLISGVQRLKVTWGNELCEVSFRQLRVLVVENAKEVVKVFPPNLEFTRFQNLEKLYITGCDVLTEVIDIRALIDVKIERGGIAVSQLNLLVVLNTPNLKHIWNEDPKGIFDFHSLSSLDIQGFPSLESVIPASVARSLVYLEMLLVTDSSIKEIVAGDEEGIDDASTFQFPQLERLVLRRLPQLETFYLGTYTSEWPALPQLRITQCYQFHLQTLFHEMVLFAKK